MNTRRNWFHSKCIRITWYWKIITADIASSIIATFDKVFFFFSIQFIDKTISSVAFLLQINFWSSLSYFLLRIQKRIWNNVDFNCIWWPVISQQNEKNSRKHLLWSDLIPQAPLSVEPTIGVWTDVGLVKTLTLIYFQHFSLTGENCFGAWKPWI